MKRSQPFPLLLIFWLLAGPVQAQDTSHCVEHPMIRPFPGSELRDNCDYKEFDEYAFWVKNADGRQVQTTVQGKHWSLNYVLLDDQGNWSSAHSILEYRENYKRAALEKGGTILFENEGYLTFTLPGEGGSTTWCQVHIWNKSNQEVRIIEVAPMVQRMTFGPAELKAALDAEGRVALRGILFDLDKDTLQPESMEQLGHVVTLLKNYPDLALEVQGHTDDQGDEAYNQELSQRRAATVVTYLGLFGIEASRLTAAGYGESEPVASNTTEEGRAQNRRVELVRK